MRIGYPRVSTEDRNLGGQVQRLGGRVRARILQHEEPGRDQWEVRASCGLYAKDPAWVLCRSRRRHVRGCAARLRAIAHTDPDGPTWPSKRSPNPEQVDLSRTTHELDVVISHL
jgi:hypothetical protein